MTRRLRINLRPLAAEGRLADNTSGRAWTTDSPDQKVIAKLTRLNATMKKNPQVAKENE
jgi:hypothetical protein